MAIQTPQELAQVPLEDQPKKGPRLRLGDVGPVVLDYQPIIGDAIINGKPGLLLVVAKMPWGNTLKVTQDVDAVIKACSRACPASTSTPRSSARRPSSTMRSTTWSPRCCWALFSWS